MKYYAIINKQKNVIVGWRGVREGVQVTLSNHERLHEIDKEQAESMGSGWYAFDIHDGKLVNLSPVEKEPTPTPTPSELEVLGQQLVNIELRLMAGGL